MNKRRIILLVIIFIASIVFGIKYWQEQQLAKQNPKRDNFEQFLDNGIQFENLTKKQQFLNDVKISNVKISEQKITYVIKNNSQNSVFLSNQLKIGDRTTLVSTTDTIDKKIELKTNEEKSLEVAISKQKLLKILDSQIDKNSIQIFKPIYQKYDSPTLIGIAKYETGE